jgi:Cys-tRNA(Pro)/Cys-tRNA(Cys) deacylase
LNQYDSKLFKYINNNNIDAEHLVFEESCHSVAEAANAVNASPGNFVKNICLMDDTLGLIVAIVNGNDRVSTSKVGRALNIARPRTATVNEILQHTGYPCGGVPSFGYDALFLIDSRVMDMDYVYTGGGSEYSLVRIRPDELRRANGAQVVSIRK